MTSMSPTLSRESLANEGISRREILSRGAASGLALAVAVAGPASAEDEHKHDDMEHMDHGDQGAHEHHHDTPAKHQSLVDAATACINRGEVCVNHCIMELSSGDTALKDCLRSVSLMLPMCAALARAGALDASRLKDIAKVCIDVCEDCEKECKKHADKHASCKACAQSCSDCIAQCKKVI
ncbi:MAG TPA: four-helix bundle copper-binding protein [Hyphomicrobium sp.]|nr:four-helix bundle copper-binding protein [Hyphomicrobium sp.]